MSYIESLFGLNGKTVIVTGASRGLGAGIALAFVKAGANVIGVARSRQSELEGLKDYYYPCDIGDQEEFGRLCSQTADKCGRIDVLVNAAGITLPSNDVQSRMETFIKTLEVNLVNTFKCCEIAVQYMKQHGGSIVNVTSIGSLMGFPGNPGYVASKGGTRSLTQSLAFDYAPDNIRVNNLVPGYMRTDMTKKSFEDPELHQQRLDRMLLKRWGTADDAAGAALFLGADASSYITGSDLVVDGGWTTKGM